MKPFDRDMLEAKFLPQTGGAGGSRLRAVLSG